MATKQWGSKLLAIFLGLIQLLLVLSIWLLYAISSIANEAFKYQLIKSLILLGISSVAFALNYFLSKGKFGKVIWAISAIGSLWLLAVVYKAYNR